LEKNDIFTSKHVHNSFLEQTNFFLGASSFGQTIPVLAGKAWWSRSCDPYYSGVAVAGKVARWYIFKPKGLAMEDVGVFCGDLVCFTAIWYIFSHFSMLYQEVFPK
jgi:hypothetical protein